MDRLTFLYLIAVLYDILSVWGVIEAVLLRLHWGWLLLLMVLLIFLPPVGFGMTMFCKYIIWKKKRGPRKKKKRRNNPDPYPDSYRDVSPKAN
jgi:hypothetical protein